MSSRTNSSQTTKNQQNQQAGALNPQPTAHSTVSTSKLRMGNGAPVSSLGVQGGGCRTEPPRSKPAYPAPSTIAPSESISVRGTPSSSNGQTRTSNDYIKKFSNGPNKASAQYTPSASWSISADSVSQAASSTYSTPPGSTTYTPPRSVRPTPASSTARASDHQMSGAVQRTGSNNASRAMGGSSAGASQQDYARDYSGGLQQQPSGISIGVPQSGNFHFHYNQVDNRTLTVNNNAPGHVTTSNNHVSNVDNSNHHNNHGPRGNTSNFHANNVGNTRTDVNQTATSYRDSAFPTSSPYLQAGLPPSESLPIRDRHYKQKKKVTPGFWGGKPTSKYDTVSDDRPC